MIIAASVIMNAANFFQWNFSFRNIRLAAYTSNGWSEKINTVYIIPEIW